MLLLCRNGGSYLLKKGKKNNFKIVPDGENEAFVVEQVI